MKVAEELLRGGLGIVDMPIVRAKRFGGEQTNIDYTSILYLPFASIKNYVNTPLITQLRMNTK